MCCALEDWVAHQADFFEALEAGRAPVIISDSWVAPSHIDWSFAIQVPEAKISDIPDILESKKGEAIERGEAARDAWEQQYSESRLFHTAISSVQRLQSLRKEHSVNAITLDKLYRTKVQLQHSARGVVRLLRDMQNDLRSAGS